MKNSADGKPKTFREKLYDSAKYREDVDKLVKESVRSSAKVEGIHRSKTSLQAQTPRDLSRAPREQR